MPAGRTHRTHAGHSAVVMGDSLSPMGLLRGAYSATRNVVESAADVDLGGTSSLLGKVASVTRNVADASVTAAKAGTAMARESLSSALTEASVEYDELGNASVTVLGGGGTNGANSNSGTTSNTGRSVVRIDMWAQGGARGQECERHMLGTLVLQAAAPLALPALHWHFP